MDLSSAVYAEVRYQALADSGAGAWRGQLGLDQASGRWWRTRLGEAALGRGTAQARQMEYSEQARAGCVGCERTDIVFARSCRRAGIARGIGRVSRT